MSSPRRFPIRNAQQSENLELGGWLTLAAGVVLSFFSGLGLLLAIGAVGLLVSVAIREQRDMHREMRQRYERLEDAIGAIDRS